MIKREKVITCLAGMIFVLAGIFAGEALAGIAASKHNLSAVYTGTTPRTVSSDNVEICVFCHTPHGAIKTDNIPLWNQALSKVTAYEVYTSPNMRPGTTSDALELAISPTNLPAVSNLCLSCHDGTVAIGSMNNPSNLMPNGTSWTGLGASGVMPATTANLGPSLKDDHPVNFTYVTTNTTLTPRASLTDVKLFDNKVQCASCHDPHSSEPLFLRVTMAGSKLCLTCHIK